MSTTVRQIYDDMVTDGAMITITLGLCKLSLLAKPTGNLYTHSESKSKTILSQEAKSRGKT